LTYEQVYNEFNQWNSKFLVVFIHIDQATTTTTTSAIPPAWYSNPKATLKTDWLSISTGDMSVYFACGLFDDPQIQKSLGIGAIFSSCK
jgi:hypothetical protein